MADQVREAQQAICWLVEDGHGYRGVTFVDPATGEGAYDGFTTTPLIAATASHAAEVEALTKAAQRLCRSFPTDDDMAAAGWGRAEIDEACNAYDALRAALKGDKP